MKEGMFEMPVEAEFIWKSANFFVFCVYLNKGVVREIWICVITLKLISNISESYDAMASKVDVLHRKMYNRQPQVIGKTFENLEIPGKPKELLVYGSKV